MTTTSSSNLNNEEVRPRTSGNWHDRADSTNTKEATNMFNSDASGRPYQPAAELTPQFVEAVLAPPYAVPAPCSLDWCRLGAEHDFTGHAMFPADGVERLHEFTLNGDSPLTVTVSAMERMDSVGVTLEAPTVSFEDPDGREFTATEARNLAAALLVAAEKLDEISGGAR